MGSEWRECTLGDLAYLNPPRQLKKSKVSPFIDMAALSLHNKYIDIKDITTRTFSGSGSRFANGDVLLARITPCLENGKTALVSGLGENVIGHGSTEFIVLSPKLALTDYLFIYYLARSPDFREFAIARMEGTSGRQRVPASAIANYRFLCPPENTRDEIGQLLSVFDDKIALNRQTSATLEAIAQALFKSWFVDFDPVRAKMEGCEPEGMDEATAALFPSELVESELGLIPKGWGICPIGDVVETLGGGTPSTKEPAYWDDGQYCWVTPKDLSSLQFPVLLDTERKITQAGVDKISSGLLPVGTLLLSSRAPVGYLAITRVPTAINQGFIAMPPSKVVSAVFLLYWIKVNMDRIEQRANGSTFMEISKKNFRPILALTPSKPCLDAFSDIAGAFFEQMVQNEQEIRSLTSIRDSLLPKLISGRLRIPQAEIKIKEILT